MDAGTLVTIIGALGGGAIVPSLVKRGIDAVSGRGRKRRDEVDRAWRRADSEARKRRVIEEHASQLRRELLEAPCVDPAAIPPWPRYVSTDTDPTPKEK